MSDKYVTSNATNKETEIVHRENPIDSIVKASKAENKADQLKDDLVAGDEAVTSSNAVFEGKEEGVVVTPPKETFYCSNCRKHYNDEEVRKEAIDYVRAEDGSLTKSASRFSVFCNVCAKFFRVIDNNAQRMLNDMIRKNVKN